MRYERSVRFEKLPMYALFTIADDENSQPDVHQKVGEFKAKCVEGLIAPETWDIDDYTRVIEWRE